MERKFYPENFERFLKGHADQFKMTPSKKVWHGIYNDLHPGRRWPSIAMSMVFIFTLVIIGHLNTNEGNNRPLLNPTSLNSSNLKKASSAKQPKQSQTKDSRSISSATNVNENIYGENDADNVTPLLSVIKDAAVTSNTQTGLHISDNNAGNTNYVVSKKENPLQDKIDNPVTTALNEEQITTPLQEKNISEVKTDKESAITTTENVTEKISSAGTENSEQENNIKTPPQANAENIRKPRKINNVTWTYYVSPSISYRILSDDKIDNSVTHTPMLGYEGGTAMSFTLYKNLKFTAGLQVNYSGYNIRANNTHPIVSTLVLNTATVGQYEVYSAMSHYGNRTGSEFTRLKNYSLQASLPIGLQYTFALNDNIKLGTAATFQPSYILANRAYLLSEDKRNYLTNPNLFRKWNMHTGLTTYVSFSSNSLNWQIGPQVRYQLLSTYTNRYQPKESLVNYGIRIGISKISQ